jgi:hypothetical protein
MEITETKGHSNFGPDTGTVCVDITDKCRISYTYLSPASVSPSTCPEHSHRKPHSKIMVY